MLYRIAQPVGPSVRKKASLSDSMLVSSVKGFRGFSIAQPVSTEVNHSVRASRAATLLDFESAVHQDATHHAGDKLSGPELVINLKTAKTLGGV